ncbi:GNAT family N-acetyltransferase [Microvirga arsenatis]|uniref:GNAT family N-acetyltransferase n=1 Tax=Microvirga arsenatis TaxID=2692265 RepID=A0ABW9YVX4_9HYPH|nr:GNAT family protein [Microvirga arsenatis]NBJ10782.1 GNAT family N-acetyltransferase [Microvirga arsenatis]NBJ24320.1 GNAT family N-acetyltransferase [Microvirga arsenatis]
MLPMLATERLRLEPVANGDLGRLLGLLIRPEIRRYLCDAAVLDRAQVESLTGEAAALAPRGLGLWSIRDEDGAWLGILGLQPVSAVAATAWPAFAEEVEPLVAIDPLAWGRGYATEAVRRAAAYARDDLGLHRLVALADEPNVRSHRLLARVGFQPVGTGQGPRHLLQAYSLSLPKRRLDSAGIGS